MVSEKKKGLIYGLIGVIFVGLQPIVAISKPSTVNPYISAAMTCLVESIIFFPLMLKEFTKKKKNEKFDEGNKISILKGWKNNFWLLIFIGIIFGVN